MFMAMLFLISKSVPIFNLVPAKGRKNIRNRKLVATESEIHRVGASFDDHPSQRNNASGTQYSPHVGKTMIPKFHC